jgi:hypothetical protein
MTMKKAQKEQERKQARQEKIARRQQRKRPDQQDEPPALPAESIGEQYGNESSQDRSS